MQHPDEGTIHSWLDGALSADEAARVEAHVKECAQCQAAVAEARGFIAASSRILTALDNAPRGVIPAAAPKKRIDPMVWRIAASVMVVALGSVLVIRERGNGGRVLETHETAATAPVSASAPPVTVLANPKQSSAAPRSDSRRSSEAHTPANSPLAPAVPTVASAAPAVASERPAAVGGNAGLRQDMRTAPAPLSARVPATEQNDFSGKVAGGVANDALLADERPLKVVGRPRAIGERLTLYEIAPGDTVMLAEQVTATLESIVVTGTGMSQQRTMAAAAAPEAKRSATLAPSRDTQPSPTARVALPAPPAASVTYAQAPDGVGTLSWKDPTSGTVMRLSGKHTRAELEEIRRRIERAKAAAADSTKRTP